MLDNVGNTVVSTCCRAEVIQISGVRGEKRDEDKTDSTRGILLMRKDLRMVVL